MNTLYQKEQYLWANQGDREWFNSGKRTFECTKLMMSVKIYAILKAYGQEIFAENVDTLHGLATDFVEILRNNPRFELAVAPQSNIVCFRFVGDGTPPEGYNALNAVIRQKLLDEGNFYIVQTTLREKLSLRVSLMNPLTQKEDLTALLAEIEEIAARIG
ncbi:pyridoxal-dependent decarboxylase [Runella slithyformis]|uniref:pyridoxal-dependent decarboxylase n=1 Tax=Runella slithyformis TaxID=106 RepID=UPI00031CE1CB|nr:pyridoxal-dependent decarboxylase [Runella slithyformis]